MRIAFISTWGPGWGGCEELWSRAATSLAARGQKVLASVIQSKPLHRRVLALRTAGIELHPWSLGKGVWHRLAWHLGLRRPGWPAVVRRVAAFKPDIVLISEGGTWPPGELLSQLARRGIPYATLSQANRDDHWPDDEYRLVLQPLMVNAARTYFVSRANLELAEYQLGCRLPNAKAILNPWTVDRQCPPPWPTIDPGDQLRLACVGRLHPPSKGQDLLLLSLAEERWKSRKWHLTFYGNGRQRGALEAMVARLGLSDKVTFGGHSADIAAVWSQNHALVLASRYEGLPLALLEALICGRPALVTAVAGNPEQVVEGRNGFVAETPTVEAVGNALERLWQNRSRLSAMGEFARHKLLAEHPVDPGDYLANELLDLAEQKAQSRVIPA